MHAYARMLKLRLVWWCIWWGLCALGLISYISQGVDAFLHPALYSEFSITVIAFWVFVFLGIVPSYVPRAEKILKKDLKKNPENLYAKAMMLEINLKKQKASSEKEREESELRNRVKAMEEEIGNMDK